MWKLRIHLNIHRFDSVRFLTTDEKSRVRDYNEAKGLEKKLDDFDKQEPVQRDYASMVSYFKHSTEEASAKYFKLRKLAQERMYRIKDLMSSGWMSVVDRPPSHQ